MVRNKSSSTCGQPTPARPRMSSGLPRSQNMPLAKLKSSKEKSRRVTFNAQGDLFVGFAVEAGGALGDGARSLLDLEACANGSSTAEIAAFITYALQRIHITTQLGVARTIRANMLIPTGARLLHLPGAVNLGVLPQVSHLPATCPEAFQQKFVPTEASSKTCSTNYGSNNHYRASSLPVCSAPHPYLKHNCSPLTG